MARPLKGLRSLGPLTAPLLGTGIVLLLGLVGLVEFRSMRGAEELQAAVDSQREILEEIVELRGLERSLSDMESGARGFLLSGREEHLAPYHLARAQFGHHRDRLVPRWARRADYRTALEHLSEAESLWRASFAEPSILRRRGAKGAADLRRMQAAAESAEGHRILEGARELIGRIDARMVAQVDRAALDIHERSDDERDFRLRGFAFILLAVGFLAVVLARGLRTAVERTRELAREVERSRALEKVKSEFVATVSHELRTPLTVIVGSLELLRDGSAGAVPETVRPLVAMAHANSLQLKRLVDDLIDFERIGSGSLRFRAEPVDLPSLLAHAVALNREFADRHGALLHLVEPMAPATVQADRERVIQVLSNLLSNAVKFSPAGEPIRVGAEVRPGWVRVSVADRGEGIPEAFRPRVFERFAQADSSDTRSKGGTGLGLAISRAIVERMGGRIGFTPGEERGTTFWFELPVAAP